MRLKFTAYVQIKIYYTEITLITLFYSFNHNQTFKHESDKFR